MVSPRPMFLLMLALLTSRSMAQGPPDAKQMLDRSMEWVAEQQNEDGSYGPANQPMVATARTLQAYGTSPRKYTEDDGPRIRKATTLLRKVLAPDGGVVDPEAETRINRTAEFVLAFARLGSGRYDDILEPALGFLQGAKPTKEEDQYLVWSAIGVLNGGKYPMTNLDLPEDARPTTANLRRAEMLARSGDAAKVAKAKALVERALTELATAPADRRIDAAQIQALGLAIAALGPEAPKITVKDKPLAAVAVLAGYLQAHQKPDGSFELGGTPLLDTVDASIGLSAAYALDQLDKKPESPARPAAPGPLVIPADLKNACKTAVERGIAYLDKNQEGGQFGMTGAFKDPGITAICLAGASSAARMIEAKTPSFFDPGCAYLVGLQKPDGSIFQQGLKVYVTSSAVLALASGGDQYKQAVSKARDYLIATQCDETEDYQPNDWGYGGIGYGDDLRPDLSNTQFALDGLRAADVPSSSATFQKALIFLQRCQNLPESGSQPIKQYDGKVVVAGNDGGGIYYPGNSQAGLQPAGDGKQFVARSYGSMTYALLKSYILAGVKRDDPKLQAAYDWLKKHYTTEVNPGFDASENPAAAYHGLFYYYLTMARCLDVLGDETIKDAAGTEHPWRRELAARVLSMQNPDGSWENKLSPRWWEGNPVLATGYALNVLAICMKKN